MADTVSLTITTAADGTGSGVSKPLNGRLADIVYVKDDYAAGVDFTITNTQTAIGLWTESNVNASTSRAPRQPTHDNIGAASLYAAAGEAVESFYVLANQTVTVAIAQGGDTKNGTFHITVFSGNAMSGHGFGLLNNVRIEKTHGYTAAGTSAVNGTEVNMLGAEGVIFFVGYGTSATDNGIHVEQDTATGMGSAADLIGTQVFLDGTETVSICQIQKPREQFLRSVADRGTSSTVTGGFAVVYGLRTDYDNNGDADNAAESHVSPAEGTK